MYQRERKELSDLCRLLYEHGLVTACDGNISMRVEEEHIVITPSRKNKGLLKPEDMLVSDLNGNVLEGAGRVSSEFSMHQFIYKKRPDVHGIVHTHPVYATAFALAGVNIPENYLIEAKVILGPTALAGYAAPGTMEMVEAIAPYVASVDNILLMNHGALTYGTGLMDAYNKMDMLESIAKTIILSKLIGDPVLISEENLQKLKR